MGNNTSHDSIFSHTHRSKPPRRSKPPFDQFLEAIKAATVKPPRLGLTEIRGILNLGFADMQKSYEVMKVAEVLKTYPSVDRWAVTAATVHVTGKLPEFQQRLLSEVCSHFARQIGFFDLDSDGPYFKHRLEEWLRQAQLVRGCFSTFAEGSQRQTCI